MWPFDIVLDAVNYLIALLGVIPSSALYSFQSFFYAVINPVITSFNLLITLVNLPIRFGDTVLTAFLYVFDNCLPQQAISYILIAQFSLVVLFRVYHFVKDVSIFGCKI